MLDGPVHGKALKLEREVLGGSSSDIDHQQQQRRLPFAAAGSDHCEWRWRLAIY